MSPFPKSAHRALEVLDFVAQERTALSSRQIFDKLAAPRSSGYELLSSLEQRGFLRKRPGGNWILGDEIHALALSRFGLGRIASKIVSVLPALQEETQEIAQLCVLKNNQTMITHAFSSLRSMRLHTDVGTEIPVNWTAAGRLLMSGLDDSELLFCFKTYARPLRTSKAIIDANVFIQEVRAAAARGYALEIAQVQWDACSIAAPVIDGKGQCIAVVSLILPVERMRNSQDTLITLVRTAAATLTHALRMPLPNSSEVADPESSD